MEIFCSLRKLVSVASLLLCITLIEGSDSPPTGTVDCDFILFPCGSPPTIRAVDCDKPDRLPCDEVRSLIDFLDNMTISSKDVDGSFCIDLHSDGSSPALDSTLDGQFNCSYEGDKIWHITKISIQDHNPSKDESPIVSGTNLMKLSHLRELTLAIIQLTGSIPMELGYITSLEHLDLSSNNLEGPIPSEIGNLSNLAYLDLSYNQLLGSVPSTLGDLYNINFLDLQWNQLTGELSSNFQNLYNLEHLDLSNNFLNGSASVVGNLSSLISLDLGYNRFEGQIPPSLGKLKSLKSLWLSENLFNGSIPEELGNLKNLTNLGLRSNKINGTLPESFSRLRQLSYFDVGGNNLTGLIPKYFKEWHSLTSLYILGNNFNGSLPPEIFSMPNLQDLWVSNLQNYPSEFPRYANLSNIISLILRNCSIRGEIPSYVGNWTDMDRLDLSFNELEGSIPDSLNHTGLAYLYLQGNTLNGSIPNWITDLPTNNVDLSFNNLTDEAQNQNKIPGQKMNFTDVPENMIINNTIITEWSKDFCKNRARNHKLAINSGGEEVRINNTNYEADESVSRYNTSKSTNWAYTCSGGFIYDGYNNSIYIQNASCSADIHNELLHKRARLCPVELIYYGFCLTEGSYTVNLYFAEIVDANYLDYSILSKRIFDVYIQDKRVLEDFNIKDEAGGPNKEYILSIKDAQVKDNNLLKIRLVWKGKGSIFFDNAFNGPLLSAISVTANFLLTKVQIAAVAVASAFALLVVLAVLWRTGVIGDRDLRGKLFELHGKTYTLKQLLAATRKFSDRNKKGSGHFGALYKAELFDQTVYAVKKLHPEFMQKHEDRIKNEFKIIQCQNHENLVPLLDGFSRGNLHLLVYEYMEGGSLETALFDPSSGSILQNNWEARLKICKDVVRGLKYLHEDSGARIIHGDVKANNVLLDRSSPPTAKLTDFGLARFDLEENPFLITKDKRNVPYIATGLGVANPTVKADVYSFGILLLEIISGKRALEYNEKGEPEYLLPKATQLFRDDNAEELVDSKLKIEDRKQAAKLVKLAIKCVDVVPDHRPAMSEVLDILESEETAHNI